MGDRDDVRLPRQDLVHDAVGESPEDGESMIGIVIRVHFGAVRNHSQDAISFRFKPQRGPWAACLLPGDRRVVFRLGLGMEYDVSHPPSPELDVSPRPTESPSLAPIAVRATGAG